MLRNILIPVVLGASLIALGCGGSTPANNKPANGNASANTEVTNSGIIAPASTASPIATPANAAPVNANATPPAKNAAPAPTNPGEKDVKKAAKPGATPASGIPDADAMRKTMGQPEMKPMQANSNSSMMMMKKKPTPEKP